MSVPRQDFLDSLWKGEHFERKASRSFRYVTIFFPAIQIQEPLNGSIPAVDLNFIALYRGRVGMGISYRVQDAFCVVLQVRVLKNIIMAFSQHLNEGCIGSVSEIFDAETPHHPRGCVAQAWGVAEILKVIKEYNL